MRDTLEAQQPQGHGQQAETPPSRARTVGGVALLVLASASALWLLLATPASRAGIVLLLALAGILGGFASLILPFKSRALRFVGVAAGIITVLAAVLAIPLGLLPPRPSTKGIQFDDFSAGFDLNKWTVTAADGSDPVGLKQAYVEGGQLHLVSPGNSTNEVNVTLWPKLPPDKTMTKISFKMTLQSQEGPSDGAVYLITSSGQGRENRFWMGPDGESKPTLGYYICKQGSCLNRSEADTSQQHRIKIGHEYAVEAFVNKAGGLQFNVPESSFATAPADPNPITNFRFYLFSDPDGKFHVTIDDVRIIYTE